LKSLLKEPLVHFLAGSVLVFGFFWATGSDRDPADYQVRIDAADIERLQVGWVQRFRRAPTTEELDSLIEQEIQEEIYYREALRLGLDRNDPLIRRRLHTKLRFLDHQEDVTGDPPDAVLVEWMARFPGKYDLPPRYDIEQAYLGHELDPEEIAATLEGLRQGRLHPGEVGQPIALPAALHSANSAEIARQFGDAFAAEIGDLEVGEWHGPVASGFGQHLVRVTARTPGRSRALDEVRQVVTNDWHAARTARLEEEAFRKYRAQYEVTVVGRDGE